MLALRFLWSDDLNSNFHPISPRYTLSSKCRLSHHKQGEGNKTTKSLYARHFVEENRKFVNPLDNYEILKVFNLVDDLKKIYKIVRNFKRKGGIR